MESFREDNFSDTLHSGDNDDIDNDDDYEEPVKKSVKKKEKRKKDRRQKENCVTPAKVYKCDFCDYEAQWKYRLKQHKEQNHFDLLSEEERNLKPRKQKKVRIFYS